MKAHSQTNRVFFMAQRGAGAAENVLEWLETLRDDEDVRRTTFCHMPCNTAPLLPLKNARCTKKNAHIDDAFMRKKAYGLQGYCRDSAHIVRECTVAVHGV
jgi:hypothetical protein